MNFLGTGYREITRQIRRHTLHRQIRRHRTQLDLLEARFGEAHWTAAVDFHSLDEPLEQIRHLLARRDRNTSEQRTADEEITRLTEEQRALKARHAAEREERDHAVLQCQQTRAEAQRQRERLDSEHQRMTLRQASLLDELPLLPSPEPPPGQPQENPGTPENPEDDPDHPERQLERLEAEMHRVSAESARVAREMETTYEELLRLEHRHRDTSLRHRRLETQCARRLATWQRRRTRLLAESRKIATLAAPHFLAVGKHLADHRICPVADPSTLLTGIELIRRDMADLRRQLARLREQSRAEPPGDLLLCLILLAALAAFATSYLARLLP